MDINMDQLRVLHKLNDISVGETQIGPNHLISKKKNSQENR